MSTPLRKPNRVSFDEYLAFEETSEIRHELIEGVIFAMSGADTTELVIIFDLMLSGAGNGATAPAMSSAIANSVDPGDLGVVGGAEQMVAQLGIAVGTQVMITVQQAAGTNDAASYAHAYLVGGLAAVIGVVAAAFVHPTVGRSAVARLNRRPASALADAA